MNNENNKPTIETIINTTAITLTGFAIATLTTSADGWEQWGKAVCLIVIAMLLEFFKYKGRQKQLW